MGVYIALGAPIYSFEKDNAIEFKKLGSLDEIETLYQEKKKILVFMEKSTHKTKKKAEQIACEKAINLLKQ